MESWAQKMSKSRLTLSGQHFRVAFRQLDSPPFYMINTSTSDLNTTSATYGGLYADVVTTLSKILNFTLEYVFPRDGSYGNCNSTTCTGMMGLVADKEADFAAYKYDVTDDRFENVAFGAPFPAMFSQWAFLVKKPSPGILSGVLVRPFSFNVWITLLTAALVVWLALSFLNYFKYRRSRRETLAWSWWRMVRVAVQQGDDIPSCDTYVPLAWVLATLLLLQVYTATMVSLFSNTKAALPFTNIEEASDLLKSGRARIALLNTPLEFYVSLFYQKGHRHRRLAVALNASEPINVETLEELAKAIVESGDVIVFSFYHAVKSRYLERFSCALTVVVPRDVDMSAVQGSFVFDKDFPFQEQFNLVLSSMTESCFAEFLSSYPPTPKQCTEELTIFTLSLIHVQEMFVVLAGGLVLALFSLLLEVFYSHFNRRFNFASVRTGSTA